MKGMAMTSGPGLARAIQALVEQHVGVFDEADLDAPFGWLSRHWAAKLMIFGCPRGCANCGDGGGMWWRSCGILPCAALREAVAKRGVVELGTDQVRPVGGASVGLATIMAWLAIFSSWHLRLCRQACRARSFLARPACLLDDENR